MNTAATAALGAGLAPGGSASYAIKPKNGHWPGTYKAVGVTVTGVGQTKDLGDFEVDYHGYINLATGQWEDKDRNPAAYPPPGCSVNPFGIAPGIAIKVYGTTTDNNHRIVVGGDPAELLPVYMEMDGVDITITGGSPLLLEADANLLLDLAEGSMNVLVFDTAGDRAGLEAPAGTRLEITGSGTLAVDGIAAGIGGGYGDDGGDITISGGTVIAMGGGGAGIGGGTYADGGTINILGGMVIALSNSYGAGIGGGYQGAGGTINILGGTVIALGSAAGSGAGIGGGYHREGGTITVSGGTVYTRSIGMAGCGIGPADGGPTTGTFDTNGGTPVIFAYSYFNNPIDNQGTNISFPATGIAGTGAVTMDVVLFLSSFPNNIITSFTVTLEDDFTVPQGATLVIPPLVTLELGTHTLYNTGAVVNNGVIDKQGTGSISNQGAITGTGIISN